MILSIIPTSHDSEGVRHTGSDWTNPDNPRLAILIAYNHVMVRFHEPKQCMNPIVIDGLSEERQKFFQDVWFLGNDRQKKVNEGEFMYP